METMETTEAAVRPEYLSYRQVEQYCGLSRQTAWRLVKSGKVEAMKIGRMVKVRRSSLDDYLDRNAYEGTN